MIPVLSVQGLRVEYRGLAVLRGVSLAIGKGQSYGLVGESGCGKSTMALAVMRALPRGGAVVGGRIAVCGRDLMGVDRGGLRQLRSHVVSMVYQDAGRALNPRLTVGRQLAEAYGVLGLPGGAARSGAAAMLERVRIADVRRVMAAYPHQLSGGMQQRVVLAMALAKDPALLVLDEPTTGLDATVEAEILDLLVGLRAESGTAMLFISHNIGLVRAMCDRVGVLYAGTLIEEGGRAEVLDAPIHPYTVQLLRCLPRADRARLETIPGELPRPGPLPTACSFAPRCALADEACRAVSPPLAGDGVHWALCHHADQTLPMPETAERAAVRKVGAPVLFAEHLSKTFADGKRAVCDVTLTLREGETLGLVGESGSGKTTLALLLLGLVATDEGVVELEGVTVAGLARERAFGSRKALQIVFQNPDSALNRSHTVRRLITRALTRLGGLRGLVREARLHELLDAVRLADHHLPMRPRQLSGGLKQRVAVARAFGGAPRVLVLDEPTSALDVSVQASILNLLRDLQAREGVSYIFISHDLAVVRYVADRIAVLYGGVVVETGPAEAVFAGPNHPYTAALLSALPGRARITLPAAPGTAAVGCVFSGRCPYMLGALCEDEAPALWEEDGYAIACHIPRAQLARREAASVQPGRPDLSGVGGDGAAEVV